MATACPYLSERVEDGLSVLLPTNSCVSSHLSCVMRGQRNLGESPFQFHSRMIAASCSRNIILLVMVVIRELVGLD